jgi:hypothetical protein
MTRQVHGIVGLDGATVSGEGFSARRHDKGLYAVSFNTPFRSTPTVVVNVFGTSFQDM